MYANPGKVIQERELMLALKRELQTRNPTNSTELILDESFEIDTLNNTME